MLNFLYCFDNGYNIQAQCSIYSLLENVDEKINIYIIHKNKNDSNFINEKITNHRYLNKIKVYKFKFEKDLFPNLENAHITQATYYRLHIENYLEDEIDFITYLDGDIICFSNPIPQINKEIENLKRESNIISANTENSILDAVERLGNKTSRYFNAGVLIINFREWKNKSTTQNLLNLLKNEKKLLKFWDQDLLNIYFNGEYVEMSKLLNYKLHIQSFKKIKKKKIYELRDSGMIFIHYSGKFKPWTVKGIVHKKCIFYQQIYKRLFEGDFHLDYNYKRNALIDLIKSIFTLTIFQVDKPLKLTILVIISLFKKNEKLY